MSWPRVRWWMANFFSLNCRLSTIASSCVRHFLFNLKILLVIFHNKKINLAAVGWGKNYEKRRQLRSLNYRHCGALSLQRSHLFITISHAKLNFCHSNIAFCCRATNIELFWKFSRFHIFSIFFSPSFFSSTAQQRDIPPTHIRCRRMR